MKKLKIGLGSANRYLKILEKEGLVIKEEKGKLGIYKANMENLLLKELKVVFTLLEIDEMIKGIKSVSNQIILFGSCADGKYTEEGDIDLFVLSDKGKSVNRIISNHQNKIERKTSPVIVNYMELRTLKQKDKPFYSRIKK